jgi:acyl-homoserine-lactone acylase
VLAYGQTARPYSTHNDDQTALFANNKMKSVAFTEAEIKKQLLREYRPGE